MATLGPITTEKVDTQGSEEKGPVEVDRHIPSVRYGAKAMGQKETVIQPEEGVEPVIPLTPEPPDPVPPAEEKSEPAPEPAPEPEKTKK